MTPTHTGTRTTQAAQVPTAEQLLRDAAFVLKLTKRVKDDILRTAAHPSRSEAAPNTVDRTPALVV